MSFPGTHTPTLAEVLGGKKAKYQLPKREGKMHTQEFYLTDKLREKFIRLFPTHTNREMMQLFGISFITVQRFKRELGLEKDMKVIRRKQKEMTLQICEENGYYDSLRGRPPSPQCLEATRKMRAEGFHPLKALKKKNPRKYRKLIQQWADHRAELRAKDKKRRRWGLKPLTGLVRCDYPYTKDQVSYRLNMKRKGYILGDPDDRHGERYTIYYDANTIRRPKAEANASLHKITIMPLPHCSENAIQLQYRNNEPLKTVFL